MQAINVHNAPVPVQQLANRQRPTTAAFIVLITQIVLLVLSPILLLCFWSDAKDKDDKLRPSYIVAVISTLAGIILWLVSDIARFSLTSAINILKGLQKTDGKNWSATIT